MEVTIRAATEADGLELARLRWSFRPQDQHPQERGAFFSDFKTWFDRALSSGDWAAAVAESNGSLVGCMFLCSVERVPAPGDIPRCWGYLTNAYIDERHRGEGIGKELLDFIVSEGGARGHDFLMVWPSGEAVSFYAQCGFEPVTAVHSAPDNPPPMELILPRSASVERARDTVASGAEASDAPASARPRRRSGPGDEEILIVPTSEEFAERINAVFDEVARERKYLAMTVAPSVESTCVFIRELLEGNGVQAVALAGDRVVGWADVVREPYEGFAHVGRFAVVVVADYRGQGLGEGLTREALRMASEAGMTKIELRVFETNARAIALYRKLGFVTEGIRRRVRAIDGLVEDELLMALFIGEGPSA